jgi:hypothetical protein
MAYISGNAIHVHGTKINHAQSCSGITIENNVFEENIGMKSHNGGAVTVYCA